MKLSGKNDVIVTARGLSGYAAEWAVLGVELKKPTAFTAQAVRQAQAEFLIFSVTSRLPFVQVQEPFLVVTCL